MFVHIPSAFFMEIHFCAILTNDFFALVQFSQKPIIMRAKLKSAISKRDIKYLILMLIIWNVL